MSSVPEALLGQLVVVDLDGPWVAFGRLLQAGSGWIELADADLHDMREGTSTRDVYALETQKLGVRVNRRRVLLPVSQIIAMSRLEDVTA